MKKIVFKNYLHALVFCCITVVSSPANSQQSVELEEVIVTGTRIVRKDIESVSPVTVTSAEEIKQTGVNRIEDMINQMPQVETSSTAMDSNGATGNASLDLRGLGSNRTLVLVNGRRLQSGGVNSTSPDVNQIPAALVKSVEVLTGGASTVYGSDAVAGVVNFIIDDQFEGLQVSANAAGYQHNSRNSFMQGLSKSEGFDYAQGNSGLDGRQYSLDVVMGGKLFDDKGHITLYGNYRTVDALLEGARDYSSCALDGKGTACGGSGTTPLANFDIYAVDPMTNEAIEVPDKPGFKNLYVGLQSDGSLSDTNLYNFGPLNYYQRPDQRWSFGGFANYKVSEHINPYMEFSYMQDRTVAQIAQSGTFYKDLIYIKCNSPLLSIPQREDICGQLYGPSYTDQQFAVYVGKRNVEGGPRQSQISHNSFRLIGGIKGDLSKDWHYDAYYQVGAVDSSEVYVNDLLREKVVDALNVVLDSSNATVCVSGNVGCVPYQVFTPNGVTQDQAASLTATGIKTGYVKQAILSGYLSGDLPLTLPLASHSLALAVGLEQRKDSYQIVPDYLYAQGSMLGQGGPIRAVDGSVTVKESYLESLVPLVDNKPLVHSLALELGLRHTDHSLTGNTETWKLGLNYAPISTFKIRGSYNRAIRSPDVQEMFESSGLALWEGNDGCAGDPNDDDPDNDPVYTEEQCLNAGFTEGQWGHVTVSSAGQYNGLFGGSKALAAEKADTYTIGFVSSPTDKLNISADYWDIKVKGYVGSLSPETVINTCAETGDSRLCSLIHRSSNGSLWQGDGYIDLITQNLGYKQIRGIDFSADYSQRALGGDIQFKLSASKLLDKFTQQVAGISALDYECAGKFSESCDASPRWRHNLQGHYQSNSFWSVGLRWRYYGAIDNIDGTVTGLNAHIASQSYFDIPAVFKIGSSSILNFGINNVLDKDPPLVGANANPDNANSFNIYDTLGRYMYANLTMKF